MSTPKARLWVCSRPAKSPGEKARQKRAFLHQDGIWLLKYLGKAPKFLKIFHSFAWWLYSEFSELWTRLTVATVEDKS
jgi:hypothetical protein